MKNKRVQYNFVLKLPSGNFTIQQLMAANPGVQYITLYMRLKKGLVGNVFKEVGVQQSAKRGRSQKVYGLVKRSHKKKVVDNAVAAAPSALVPALV